MSLPVEHYVPVLLSHMLDRRRLPALWVHCDSPSFIQRVNIYIMFSQSKIVAKIGLCSLSSKLWQIWLSCHIFLATRKGYLYILVGLKLKRKETDEFCVLTKEVRRPD